MSIVAIIPARMASSRFPDKPLKHILGLSMIEHVRRRVSLCNILDDVIVATCDKEIADEIEHFGGKVAMTSDRHESCVDRVAEAALKLDAGIVINVQGDMPLIHPGILESLVKPLIEDKGLLCTDVMGPIEDESEFYSPNIVKVVQDMSGNALYYSREPIPSLKKVSPEVEIPKNKQFGINAFRHSFLIKFTNLQRTTLEKIESVDMLRILENGYTVRLVSAPYPVVGVDMPEDLEKAEEMMKADPIFPLYINK